MLDLKPGKIENTKTVRCAKCERTETVKATARDFEKYLTEVKSWHKRAGFLYCPRCV